MVRTVMTHFFQYLCRCSPSASGIAHQAYVDSQAQFLPDHPTETMPFRERSYYHDFKNECRYEWVYDGMVEDARVRSMSNWAVQCWGCVALVQLTQSKLLYQAS